MAALASRRDMLRLMGGALAGATLIPLIGCGDSSDSPDGGNGNGACDAIPQETGGPYPGDGTNGPNVLDQTGIVRSDIRSSFGALSGTASGVPMTVTLTLLDSKSSSCAPLAGHAVYLWHCTLDGKYSLYTEANQNYLRGVQETDASGQVTFTSIYPGCYSGRWPHIHFEVFTTLAGAMAGTGKVKTSQLAMPKAASDTVYASSGYSASVSNFSNITLSSDNVFSDGASLETATATGSVASGYTVALSLGV